MKKVIVIDDYHCAFGHSDAIIRLRQTADVTVYEDPFPSQNALAEALHGVEIIIANRERTKFTSQLLG